MKRGDLLPTMTATIAYRDQSLDITTLVDTNTPCVFLLRSADTGTLKVNRGTAAVIAVGTAEVTAAYSWQSGDTDTAGTYHAEFELAVGGLAWTAPTTGHITVIIEEDLD